MGPGRMKRLAVLGLGCTALLLGTILLCYPQPDLSAEQHIVHKIAELSQKLKHADSLNDQRKMELQVGNCIHLEGISLRQRQSGICNNPL